MLKMSDFTGYTYPNGHKGTFPVDANCRGKVGRKTGWFGINYTNIGETGYESSDNQEDNGGAEDI